MARSASASAAALLLLLVLVQLSAAATVVPFLPPPPVEVIAGSDAGTPLDQDGVGTASSFSGLFDMAYCDGYVYFTQDSLNTVRRVTTSPPYTVSLVVDLGAWPLTYYYNLGLAVDSACNNLYVTTNSGYKVLRVSLHDPSSIFEVAAVNGTSVFAIALDESRGQLWVGADAGLFVAPMAGGPAVKVLPQSHDWTGIAVDTSRDRLYIASGDAAGNRNVVRYIDLATRAGPFHLCGALSGTVTSYGYVDGPCASALFELPMFIKYLPGVDYLLVTDGGSGVPSLRALDLKRLEVVTVAGCLNASLLVGTGTDACLNTPLRVQGASLAPRVSRLLLRGGSLLVEGGASVVLS
eukprot:tig00000215_g18551.t1